MTDQPIVVIVLRFSWILSNSLHTTIIFVSHIQFFILLHMSRGIGKSKYQGINFERV